MIRVAGHSRSTGSRVYPEDAAQPLFVNCCGYQCFTNKDFSIHRTEGRPDYQILYVYKGCGHFYIDGSWQTMPAGTVILYRPSQPQIYTYRAQDKPEIYWIHFLGRLSEELIETYGIGTCYVGRYRILKQVFEEIISELQLHKPLFSDVVCSDFRRLLALIRRFQLTQNAPTENNALIDQLIIKLNKEYMEPWDLSSMAGFCSLSTNYFAHLFKQVAHVSPMQFLNQLRIEKAKEFLLTESLSVSEVAALVGYKDPLYFSRMFKKVTGTSPKMFHGNRWLMD